MIGGLNLRYVRVEPIWLGVLVLLLLLRSLFCYLRVCICSECPPGLRYFNIYIILSSPPPDGPSSGTESNLPVVHPTRGTQIVDYKSLSRALSEGRGFNVKIKIHPTQL